MNASVAIQDQLKTIEVSALIIISCTCIAFVCHVYMKIYIIHIEFFFSIFLHFLFVCLLLFFLTEMYIPIIQGPGWLNELGRWI